MEGCVGYGDVSLINTNLFEHALFPFACGKTEAFGEQLDNFLDGFDSMCWLLAGANTGGRKLVGSQQNPLCGRASISVVFWSSVRLMLYNWGQILRSIQCHICL